MTGPRIEYVDQLLLQILPAFEAGFAKDLSADQLSIFRSFAGNYLKINSILAERSILDHRASGLPSRKHDVC